ncbi:hypothetical protein [Parapedobacter indicus]|uniref:Uncharacterized protein n=1 Tax=Parapedobacter indicus TaxID=1477437 RepID=A0A1I3IKV8_9SPHI|nr:hypothetical protein [Parapedobacter indicus]PPL02206.1 hypothetical protein CLV26_104131 [Parapedobacter indicus]SFI48467.1 hypothetical protein SAMN05444682_104131 [Parapedobacter indicus]
MNGKFTLLFLLIATAFPACEKADLAYEDEFNRSYETWLDFKASSDDSYRYVVTGASWAGSAWETTITVEKGMVTKRDFLYTRFNDVWMPESGWTLTEVDEILVAFEKMAHELSEQEKISILDDLQWSETEEELDAEAHASSPAGAPITLDDIYDTARNVWLKSRSDASVSFKADNNGILSSAGFVPKNCMDDCFSGIYIRSIEAL